MNKNTKKMTLEEVNDLTKRAIYVFKEILDYEYFRLDVQQNGVMGTQYKFKQISILTGITEIYITPIADVAPDGTHINGLKIDHIETSSPGIGIGAKLIAILANTCDTFDLDLCLWSEDNKRLKRWYRKLGFKENHTNSRGETLFILKKYNFENVMEMLGKDKIIGCSKIAATMSITEEYLKEIFKDK